MNIFFDTITQRPHPAFWLLAGILAVWELVWKGMGLWRAARNSQSGWFVAMLLLNTLGLLPILYLHVFGKHLKKEVSSDHMVTRS